MNSKAILRVGPSNQKYHIAFTVSGIKKGEKCKYLFLSKKQNKFVLSCYRKDYIYFDIYNFELEDKKLLILFINIKQIDIKQPKKFSKVKYTHVREQENLTEKCFYDF